MKLQQNKLLIGLILFLAIRCGEIENEYLVDIDQETSKVILSYIKENNIDTQTKVIVTRWVITPFERSDIYISNTYSANYKELESAPSYYCILKNGTVVFIYTNLERLIDRGSNKVVDEINQVLRRHEVKLEPDSAHFYYAPTWLYSVCGNTKAIQKKIPALEYTTIPCDYVLLQDTVTKNTLQLIKRD